MPMASLVFTLHKGELDENKKNAKESPFSNLFFLKNKQVQNESLVCMTLLKD